MQEEHATWSHDENVPLGTFWENAKYVLICMFRDIFDVKWSAKIGVNFFFPETDERAYVLCDIAFVGVTAVLTWNVHWVVLFTQV